ncbi:MAG: FtsX-like permease family protein [Bacteroidia bacterium]
MISNAIKIAFRNLARHKVYSLINIAGLSVGISCCLLILLHVSDEFSYDRFHQKGDRIYRMALERIYPDRRTFYAIIPSGIGEAAKDEFPEIETLVRLWQFGQTQTFRYGEQSYEESAVMFADSNFFQVFDIPLLEGDPEKVLSSPNTIILTEETAFRYFKGESALGKILETQNGNFEVVGICGNVPENSHFDFDLLASAMNLQFFIAEKDYLSFSTVTYFMLKEGADPAGLEAKFPGLVEKYASGQIQRRLGKSYAEYVAAGNGYRYFLQPLWDIHLHSQLEGEFKANGNSLYVWLFISIAFFILIIACINFMNLATARSSERAREVGIRKVLGSHRSQLILQFLVESVIISAISLVVSLVIIQFALPGFNELAGKHLNMDAGTQWWIPVLLVFTVLIVGLMAGSYPAFVLSSFEPVSVLKGAFKSTRKGTFLRNGLVVFQFGISTLLIASTAVIYQQMQFVRTKNLGFDKDFVVVIERINALEPQKAENFREEIGKIPGVLHAAISHDLPGGNFFGYFLKASPSAEIITGRGMFADEYFPETMNLEIIKGRGFSKEFNDTLSIILNETMVNALGMTDPIGKQVINPGDTPEATQILTIVGVVKDFHFQSLHEEIAGLAIISTHNPTGFRGVVPVKISPENVPATLAGIEAEWTKINPDIPFSYHFLDDQLAQLYQSEQASGKLFAAFSIIAILIASIGLFGLATFLAQQRTKEIGIRKVLGASVSQLVILLSKEITLLVLLALVISIPLTWILMDKWLEDFVYRVNVHPGVFLMAGVIALAIAWITVSYQSFKTALSNPVEALRDE